MTGRGHRGREEEKQGVIHVGTSDIQTQRTRNVNTTQDGTRRENERDQNGGKSTRETLLLSSKGPASFGGALSSSGASLVIWSEDVGIGFSGVAFVNFFNEFVGVREIGSGGPLELDSQDHYMHREYLNL